MTQDKRKKIVAGLIPYVFIALFMTKIGQSVRLAGGDDIIGRIRNLPSGFSLSFQDIMPSLNLFDILIGIVSSVILKLAASMKSKNAKKYRHNIEYGSARWGTAEDIAPFEDPVFRNNVILTKTERLTMNSRPKDPKNSRNKNVLIVGGSGSGKTRFVLKPNLMQCHSSYVITDPNVYTIGG